MTIYKLSRMCYNIYDRVVSYPNTIAVKNGKFERRNIMTKRIIAMLLCALMILSMIPVMAISTSAAD